MAAIFSNTSLITLKTKSSVLLAADSRATDEWLNIVSNDYPKIFRLRDNLYMGFSGSFDVFYEIRRRINETVFPGQVVPDEAWSIDSTVEIVPKTWTMEYVASTIQSIANDNLLGILSPHSKDPKRVALECKMHGVGIFVVGWDNVKGRPSVLLVASDPIPQFPWNHSVREEADVMACLGTGSRFLRNYYENHRANTIHEDMNEDVAIEFAKNAIVDASRDKDWGTGGKIHIIVVANNHCRARSFSQLSPERCMSSYSSNDDTTLMIS